MIYDGDKFLAYCDSDGPAIRKVDRKIASNRYFGAVGLLAAAAAADGDDDGDDVIVLVMTGWWMIGLL